MVMVMLEAMVEGMMLVLVMVMGTVMVKMDGLEESLIDGFISHVVPYKQFTFGVSTCQSVPEIREDVLAFV